MAEGHVRETSIALTPVGDGRLEIYVDGRKVYDRKEAGEGDFYPSLSILRKIKPQIEEHLKAAVSR